MFRAMRAFGAVCVLGLAAVCGAQTSAGVMDLYNLQKLPRFREFVKVGSFSSYDRSGGNDDGFSGKYSYLRKVDGALVIAEINGPGVITRIHTPTPLDAPIEFVFDGESKPRLVLPFRELFSGKHAPFTGPLVGHAVGGYYSYVPLQFKKSIQIRVRAPKMQFYQINYALYPQGTDIASFDPDRPQFQEEVRAISRSLDPGEIANPPGAQVERQEHVSPPGETVTLFDQHQAGRIVGLRISSAARLAAAEEGSLRLRATWDDDKTPAILCPVGDFFGAAFGQPAAESLFFGTHNDTDYVYFPMPFDRSARIEVVADQRLSRPISFQSEVLWTREGRQAGEGRFYAHWQSERPVPQGEPFTFVETLGRGHLVGVILQAQGREPGQTSFFEGDDEATLDGELTVHGTGSEDFFNGGWYDVAGRWYERTSLPFSGALLYEKPAARTGAYRILLPDAYSFHKSLKFTIEHGPEGNLVPADYTAVSFLYLQQAPTSAPSTLEPAGSAPSSIRRLAFIPGWNQPIYAFSLDNMTLSKIEEKLPDQTSARFLAIQAHGEESFGPHYIAFTVNLPEAADYDISVEGVTGPDRGTMQLLVSDEPVGSVAHFASAEQRLSGQIHLGVLSLARGENHLFFRLGSETKDAGPFEVALVKIVCERK